MVKPYLVLCGALVSSALFGSALRDAVAGHVDLSAMAIVIAGSLSWIVMCCVEIQTLIQSHLTVAEAYRIAEEREAAEQAEETPANEPRRVIPQAVAKSGEAGLNGVKAILYPCVMFHCPECGEQNCLEPIDMTQEHARELIGPDAQSNVNYCLYSENVRCGACYTSFKSEHAS